MKTYKVTVDKFRNISWFNDKDQLHREDGPAQEYANGEKSWWLNNACYTERQWKEEIARLKGPTQEEINKALEVLSKATGYKITKT